MRRHLRACLVGSAVAALLLMLATSTLAQDAQVRGEVHDEWDNPIEGATVRAESSEGGAPGNATADADGEFLITGLDSQNYSFTARAAGYQGVRLRETRIREGAGSNRPLSIELSVLQRGISFDDETTFVSDPAGTTITFDDDGTFEFEDAGGEGMGTYGIEELTATLVVREYDGPEGKFSISDPLMAEFADKELTNFMMGDQKLMKK